MGKIVVIYFDNENAVSRWKKGRSRNSLGMIFLAAWELQKYELNCKTSTKWLHTKTILLIPFLGEGFLRGLIELVVLDVPAT